MSKKTFPLRVILTVTTGRLLTEGKGPNDNGIGDLYEILGFMTNDSPMTHQLGRFAEECKPWLYRWFPELQKAEEPKWLARFDTLIEDSKHHESETIESAIETWLKWIQEPGTLGLKSEYEIGTIPMDDHERKNPYDELVIERGTDEGIIPIVVDDD